MANGTALTEARDEVLRKIGRNLVNFQRMEAMLKYLNANQCLSGTVSDFAEISAKARKEASKMPMGRLAEEFVRSVYSSHETTEQRDSDSASVMFSFRIEADAALVAERKKALRAVVRERNKLVHQWLTTFDPSSPESCQKLGAALDEQDAGVLPEFEILRSIVRTLRESQLEATQYLASEAFLAERAEEIILVKSLQGLSGKYYKPEFVPEGPIIVQNPRQVP